MWSDRLRQHYWWAEIGSGAEKFLYELHKAEDEEDTGIYLLQLYLNNEVDLEFFDEKERHRVRQILAYLICETEKHRKILGKLASELEAKRVKYNE